MSAYEASPEAGAVLEHSKPVADWGRVVMVPLSAVFGGVAILQLMSLLAQGGAAPEVAVAGVTGILTALFYSLIIWAYLRRGRASATTRVLGAVLAAPLATFLPFSLPFLGSGEAPATALLLGNALLITGLTWSVWSVRCLDRSLSVVPQARQLVDHGPYARVRHPLYLGEIIAMLGLALTLGGTPVLVAWLGLVALQGYRAVHEERLLGACVPEYELYRSRTARIIPAIF